MKKPIRIILVFLILFSRGNGQLAGEALHFYEKFIWSEFSVLPSPSVNERQYGLAGAFSGVIGKHLVIAGGTNFPDGIPWGGGTKKWRDDIYVIPLYGSASGMKIFPGAFPRPLAYGVSVTLPEGILCIGGCDWERSYPDVFLMQFRDSVFSFTELPSLPVPLAYSCWALVSGKIYVAGGGSDSVAASRFLVLDTKAPGRGWIILESWPGPERAFAVAAGQSDGFDNCFYLFSGRNYGRDIPLQVLRDGYVYNPRLDSWKRLDFPQGPEFPVMAGTAMATGANHILLLGGSDGKLMEKENQLRIRLSALTNPDSICSVEDSLTAILENHPGFSREVLFYHTVTNTVFCGGRSPFPVPVTTNLVKSGDHYFVTSGEIRPGVRIPQILSFSLRKEEKSFGAFNILVIVVYFGILAWMGWFFSKRQKNTNDYFRGGGRIPWWAAGLSIFGTALSAITFMAIPAKAYATDWSYILLNAGIVLVAPIIIFLFIPFFRRINATTAYEYVEQRFNLASRLICSAAYILFQIGRMGIVLFLPSIALNVVTGIDIFVCITLMGILSLVYTMMGGIEAVIWTDAFQVVVLMGGALLAIVLIVNDVDGGMNTVITQGLENGKFHLADTRLDLKNPTLWAVLIASLFTSITTYGSDQTMVQRYLTTRDEKTARKSVWTNAVLTIPASLIFFFTGTALYVYYKQNPALLSTTITEGDAIFPWYIFTQMPAGISGLLISGIFAAAMSTLSASMNSATTAWVVDFQMRLGLREEANQLKSARMITMIMGMTGIIFALMMATWDVKSLWDEFNKVLGLILGGLGGLFLLGILTRKANGIGAVTGIAGSVIFQLWVGKTQPVHLLLYTTTGFISCFLIGYLVSLLFPRDRKNITHLTIYGLLLKNKTG